MSVFKNSKWIGADKTCVSPIITKKFNIDTVTDTSLFITGLGYFEAKINGQNVTDYKFLPVVSDYEPRDFSLFAHKCYGTTTNRVYYYQFDITNLLLVGENVLTIELGNGFYRQEERTAEGKTTFGDTLKCIYKIANDDTQICSDGSESYTDSNVRFSNMYLGETIDYTAKLQSPQTVDILPAPNTILSEAIGTPDKVIRTIKPTKIADIDGKQIFDAGENITGLVMVKTSAPSGSKITIRYAEVIKDDSSLNFDSTISHWEATRTGELQIMKSTFITDGVTRTIKPRFVWYAFRYFEIEGEFDDLTIEVVHADAKVSSTFTSNHEGMNFLYDAFVRTQLDNMHGSIPSDCPHRERLGYTGDGQIAAPAVMLTLDTKEFYKKWIIDILDCQDVDGHVRHTAPFMGGGGGPGGWGSAIVNVPYHFYKSYGDVDMLDKCYNPMKKWIEYLISRQENGLIAFEDIGGWCLGDWCTLEKTTIPESFVNTCYFIKNLIYLEEIATILGKNDDIPYFVSLRQAAEKAVKDAYYNADTGGFADGIQGADAYAVWCGLSGQELADKLAQKYDALGHFDTGFLCTDILCEVLFDYGHADTALKLFESEELGSYLYMKRHGATTIWEHWGGASRNHPMFGACTRQLFTSILGIKQREGTAGYCDVIIDPAKTTRKLNVSGSITTPNGVIAVSLDTTGEKAIIKVDAPKNIKIEIR
ncbi:MAG: family 78 glycoside hydrolase catalytic domain [Clostridia bacterium]|nr:family 78 glycoside hydrolase catalytic domain [Clostridia bacterium]